MEFVKVGSYVSLFVFLLLSWFMALGGLARVADKSDNLSEELGLAWFTLFLQLLVLIGTVVLGGLSHELFEKSKKFITYMFVILTVFTVYVTNQAHILVDHHAHLVAVDHIEHFEHEAEVHHSGDDLKTGFEVATAGFAMLSMMNFLFIAVFSIFLEDSTLNIPVIAPRPHETQMSSVV